MRKIRILVFGDSHTHSIKQALENRERKNKPRFEVEAYQYSKLKNGRKVGDLSEEDVGRMVALLDANDLVVSTIGGNQHQVLSLVQHPVPFNLCLPGEVTPNLQAVDSIIPYAQMRDYFEKSLRKNGVRMRQIRARAKCAVLHLTPPPPKEDTAHILKRHESNFSKAGILERGISPAPLRLKMWLLQNNVLQSLTAEWGITLLPPPDATSCSKGYLAPVYYADDATHANAAYGEEVLQQLERIASG